MLERWLHKRIEETLKHIAAVVILGPRQVGKTTLAQSIAAERVSTYLDLEDPGDLLKLEDPRFYFEQNRDKLIVIDEIQRKPDLFNVLRGQIDRNRRTGHLYGQFLLLGSASRELLNQSAESLAGRVSYQELRPLNVLETGSNNIHELWLRGGFPESKLNKEFSYRWRRDFIRTYLERDIPALGPRIPAETLRRFWTMLAHNQGQLFNASQIGGNLNVSGQTAVRYLDLMVDLMLVRRLNPWYVNVAKRLVKSPKTYLCDSGILHALLNIQSLDDLLGHPIVGSSWEGFVIENLLSAAPPEVDTGFYRTSAGAEIDLILSLGSEQWAVEIKRTTAPKLTRGFHAACEDVKPAAKWVVYTGNERYRLRDNVNVVPLPDLMEELAGMG